MNPLPRGFSSESIGDSAGLYENKLTCCGDVRLVQVRHIRSLLERRYSVRLRDPNGLSLNGCRLKPKLNDSGLLLFQVTNRGNKRRINVGD